MADDTKPLAEGERGYRAKVETGVMERRARPKFGSLVSEIERVEPKKFIVRTQFGAEKEFTTFGAALQAAKVMAWDPDSVAALAAKTETEASSGDDAGEEPQPKRRRQRRSGKANGPRTSDGEDHPVETRVDESIKNEEPEEADAEQVPE